MIRWPSAAFAVAALAILLPALPARADVPPLPTSPDAHCTLAEQCAHGVFCPYTFHPGGPPKGNAAPVGEACRADAQGKGLERRCRHGGNYAGDELYCPKGETGSWTPPNAAKPPPATTPAPTSAPTGNAADAGAKGTSRCSASAQSLDGNAPAVPWIAALFVLWGRARKARKARR